MSKFKISPSIASKPSTAIGREEFIAGAALVQSRQSSRPVKPVRLNLDLDPQLHKRLKLCAIENETTVAALVRDLILRELA